MYKGSLIIVEGEDEYRRLSSEDDDKASLIIQIHDDGSVEVRKDRFFVIEMLQSEGVIK